MLLGYPRPSLAGKGVPWVLTGTHRCALMPRVASRHSANPFEAGVVLKPCGQGRGRRCVVVNILSGVGTENTYTPGRLEALFTSSQSSPFVPPTNRGPNFLASDTFTMFREEICSVVLRELLDVCVEPLNCTSPAQPAGCSSRAFRSKFPCPHNSPSCTSS